VLQLLLLLSGVQELLLLLLLTAVLVSWLTWPEVCLWLLCTCIPGLGPSEPMTKLEALVKTCI
jgi:hypothetical protein